MATDDRFFPCFVGRQYDQHINEREAKILAELNDVSLMLYKSLRNEGATVSEAIEKVELAEDWAKNEEPL